MANLESDEAKLSSTNVMFLIQDAVQRRGTCYFFDFFGVFTCTFLLPSIYDETIKIYHRPVLKHSCVWIKLGDLLKAFLDPYFIRLPPMQTNPLICLVHAT